MTSLRILGGTDASGRGISLGVENGQQGAPSADSAYLDATGLTIVPGFIDIQINGGYGHDFTHDPASIWEVGSLLPASGVTSFCPTIITSPHERVAAAQHAMTQRPGGYRGAEPLGLHVEGPHISDERRGTHPADLLRPPTESMITPEQVRIVTLAPELPGAIELIHSLVASGVLVSVGHSAATASQTRVALDAGATLGTHLFNAMPPMTAREPGVAGVVLADPRVSFGVIVDGHHHDPAMVALAWAAAPDRFCLISDGIAAMDLPDGDYSLGSIDVTVTDGAARNTDGALAGACTPIDRELRLLMEITGASLAEAMKAATFNPAEAIGAWDRGRIRRGSRADLTLLDGLDVVATIVGGDIVHLAEQDRWKGNPDVAS